MRRAGCLTKKCKKQLNKDEGDGLFEKCSTDVNIIAADGQGTDNVTLRNVCATTVAVQKQ